jgi:hypothetical protein
MSEESVVLVGGRRNLPQIFVEHENSGQLRYRYIALFFVIVIQMPTKKVFFYVFRLTITVL